MNVSPDNPAESRKKQYLQVRQSKKTAPMPESADVSQTDWRRRPQKIATSSSEVKLKGAE